GQQASKALVRRRRGREQEANRRAELHDAASFPDPNADTSSSSRFGVPLAREASSQRRRPSRSEDRNFTQRSGVVSTTTSDVDSPRCRDHRSPSKRIV